MPVPGGKERGGWRAEEEDKGLERMEELERRMEGLERKMEGGEEDGGLERSRDMLWPTQE